jgi:hypothetical protein
MVVLSGWFLVTIVAPLVSPLIAFLVLRLLPMPAPLPSLKMMMAVKDGQWCWAVIAMGASAIYELWEAKECAPGWAGWAMGVLIIVMLSAMLVAAGGAAFSTSLLTTAASGVKAWATHYRVFVGSIVMTVVAAFIYTIIHFSVTITCGGHNGSQQG